MVYDVTICMSQADRCLKNENHLVWLKQYTIEVYSINSVFFLLTVNSGLVINCSAVSSQFDELSNSSSVSFLLPLARN